MHQSELFPTVLVEVGSFHFPSFVGMRSQMTQTKKDQSFMKAKFFSVALLMAFGFGIFGLPSAQAGGIGVIGALNGFYRYNPHTGEKYNTGEAARTNAWEVVSSGLVITSGIVMLKNIKNYGGSGKGWAWFLIIAEGSSAQSEFVSEMETKFGMDRADASALASLMETREGDTDSGVEYTWSVSQESCAKIAKFPSLSASTASAIQAAVCE
jgi:hypothetical protein